jgi:integrase
VGSHQLNRLKDAQVKALTKGDKVRRIYDGGGMMLEVLPRGEHGYKRWIFKFAWHGRERRMSLGAYPGVTLKAAREKRDEARRLVRNGINPITAKEDAKREQALAVANSVELLCTEWIAQQRTWTAAYREDVVRQFAQHVYGPIGRLPIAEVTPAMLLRLVVAPLVARDRLETARRLRQKLELVWNHALLTDRARFNAALPLKGQIAAPTITNFPSAKESELPTLLVGVRGYGNRLVEHAVLLQLLTGTRPGETRGACWDEVDLDGALWSIPAARTKRRRDHLVPLSTQALDVLRSLQALTSGHPVLFPSRSRWDAPMSEGAILMAFDRVGFGHVTAHGFRSLFSTSCHEYGHPSHIIEACLAHLDTGVKAVYNKALYLPQRRDLLQWWGDRVEGLCAAHTTALGALPIFPLTPATRAAVTARAGRDLPSSRA